MKRVIIAAVLLVALAVCCAASYHFIDRTATALDGISDRVLTHVEGGDLPAARAAMQENYALWRRRYRPLSALVRHNELDDLERLYQRAMQALDNDDNSEALLQLRELRAMLRHLPEMERPDYANLL